MLKQNNGYIFIEVLIASGIIMMLVYTIVPITTLLHSERKVLHERRLISSQLHDEILTMISEQNQKLPRSYSKSISSIIVTFEFNRHQKDTFKGCAIWENSKENVEEFCLYGS